MTTPNSPAWYDGSTTADTDTVRTHAVYGAPTDAAPAPVVGKAARTVSARVTAAIGVVAFLLGAGLSMLTGPLLGGGPGGPGDGQGGPPGTSQQSTQQSVQQGTTGTGTASS